ncbi:maleylpyruvate isomerase N-terminal domain-containing protein [Nocardioides mangrovi]|uniref:Maleylpyruvate isomerase N-terminal domain-containing protein n=1 Tax=Nocardioides mangrovi TaxID=2874580 RepID=A0ABS7UG14_9ACTN|nr:maleylpyruvate isomerase N-terminal domain-containing protein [Nocardioides mangrovi]MBZ5739961.1 maleylpyruvate isomerase N-terminal domain-containing protein [Nocardioides mangrovi]
MALTVDLETGRTAFADSVRGFLAAVDGFDEWGLLDASRCHGWTRLDVVVHVIAGWQEMLGGMVSPVADEPTVDAASYWPTFDETEAGEPVDTLMAQRRRTAAFARPSSACTELRYVAEAVLRGAAALAEGHYLWQHQVFTAGDYLTIWAVEDVIHQVDLISDHPVPATALDLARATVAELGGASLAGRLPEGG